MDRGPDYPTLGSRVGDVRLPSVSVLQIRIQLFPATFTIWTSIRNLLDITQFAALSTPPQEIPLSEINVRGTPERQRINVAVSVDFHPEIRDSLDATDLSTAFVVYPLTGF
jgi:hypothetical protein